MVTNRQLRNVELAKELADEEVIEAEEEKP